MSVVKRCYLILFISHVKGNDNRCISYFLHMFPNLYFLAWLGSNINKPLLNQTIGMPYGPYRHRPTAIIAYILAGPRQLCMAAASWIVIAVFMDHI